MDVYDAHDEVFLPQDFQTDAVRTFGRCSVSTLSSSLAVVVL